jgi:putative flippase GtrA
VSFTPCGRRALVAGSLSVESFPEPSARSFSSAGSKAEVLKLLPTIAPDSPVEIRACAPAIAERDKARKSTVFVEIRRFIVVGLVNTCLDLAVLNFLIFLTHMGRNGLWFSVFKSISFLVAVSNSYFINHSWTFRGASGRTSIAQASQFLAVSLLGALINVSSASYVATFVPAIRGMEIYWPSIAALAGTACGPGFNFIGYKHIVFAKARSSGRNGTS